MTSIPKKIVLAGAGHAHIGLLRKLARKRPDKAIVEMTLLSDALQTLYSGMLPGFMAGHYCLDEITIDIKGLCQQAGVRLVQQSVARIDADAQRVQTATHSRFDYDILSLNTGAGTDLSWLHSSLNQTDAVIPIRPLSTFIERWQQILRDAQQSVNYRLAIVGAGAAATELVMAAQVALQRIHPNHQAILVCGKRLLSRFDATFQRRVIRQLKRLNIQVINERATGYEDGQLLTTAHSLPIGAVIAATGIEGAAWSQHTDLHTVDNGFIAVNSYQQSISHPNVFAVGDVATRVDKDVAHSGVHAVHGGAVMADNLYSWLKNEPLSDYQPSSRTLYLLSCGDKYAIASFGSYSLEGRWVWYVKRYIDKRFIKK